MKKIKKTSVLKASTILLCSALAVNLISCSSEDAAISNVSNKETKSFKMDGIAKVYTLGTFDGRAAEVFKSDNHLEINPLDYENIPSDINTVYINTSTVTDAEIESFKNSVFYTDFLNKGMSIVLDSKTAHDSTLMKKTTLALDARYTYKTCASIITKKDNRITQNIPIWDHNLVSFKVKNLPETNSIFMIKSYIYEPWDGEQNDPTALSRYETMMSVLGLSVLERNTTNTNMHVGKVINKGSLTVPQIKEKYDYYDGWNFKASQSTSANSYKRLSNYPNLPLLEVTLATFDGTVTCAGGSDMNISVTNTETKSFSWSMSVSIGGKLAYPDKAVPKLFGMDLKEIAPGAGAGFSATYSRSSSESSGGVVPAYHCGRMTLKKKSGLANGRFLASKITFEVIDIGSDGNDVFNTYQYTPTSQNIEVNTASSPYWQDMSHSIHINQPYVHTSYFAVETWKN